MIRLNNILDMTIEGLNTAIEQTQMCSCLWRDPSMY